MQKWGRNRKSGRRWARTIRSGTSPFPPDHIPHRARLANPSTPRDVERFKILRGGRGILVVVAGGAHRCLRQICVTVCRNETLGQKCRQNAGEMQAKWGRRRPHLGLCAGTFAASLIPHRPRPSKPSTPHDAERPTLSCARHRHLNFGPWGAHNSRRCRRQIGVTGMQK